MMIALSPWFRNFSLARSSENTCKTQRFEFFDSNPIAFQKSVFRSAIVRCEIQVAARIGCVIMRGKIPTSFFQDQVIAT